MSYNIFYAYKFIGGPTKGFEQTVKLIQEDNPDIIAVSEVATEGAPFPWHPRVEKPMARELARRLGYYYFDLSQFYFEDNERTGGHPAIWANAILSRYPFKCQSQPPLSNACLTPDEECRIQGCDDTLECGLAAECGSPLGLSALIDVDGTTVQVFSLNLDWKPYPAYLLSGISYYGSDGSYLDPIDVETIGPEAAEALAIAYANEAHAEAMAEVEQEMATMNALHPDIEAVIIMGDMNEPSHLDWTQAAADAGVNSIKVDWPVSTRLEELGFVDAYRAFHPDELTHRGLTWTNTTDVNDPSDKHDRIDYIFVQGMMVDVHDAIVIGESLENADVALEGRYPSDHRVVSATVEIMTPGP
jgi:endonuclease/exonuclease/phosphatase family metal-dependent hydrolase